jgi:hypothetical protein
MSSEPPIFIAYGAQGRRIKATKQADTKVRAHAARWAYQKAQQQGPETESSAPNPSIAVERGYYRWRPQAIVRGPPAPGDRRKRKEVAEQPPLEEGWWPTFNLDRLSAGGNPLQSYPVTLDSNRFRSIEYFPQLWSRWAADLIPNRADRDAVASVSVAKIVQRCLTDELHMIAFISYVLQRAPGTKVSKVFLLQTAGKALSELRSRIESGNASLEEVIWPIIFLAHYELFGSESVGAGRAHLNAVVALGGMEYLDEVTKNYIRRMDRGWWSNYPSIFPRSDAPRQTWVKLVPNIPSEDIAGLGFTEHVEILGSDLAKLLPFAVDCVRAGVLCKERANAGSEDEALQRTVIQQCQGLMDVFRECLPAEPERMACIYPTMIWLQYTTWVMRDLATKASASVNAYRKITSHAHPNLLRCIGQSSQAQEMLLWAAAVGTATSSDESVRMQYGRFVLTLARALNIVDLQESWKKFIWFEDCAVVNVETILATLDEVVLQHPLLANQQWPAMRKALWSDGSPGPYIVSPGR